MSVLFYFYSYRLYSLMYLEKRNTHTRVICLRACTGEFRNPYIDQFRGKVARRFQNGYGAKRFIFYGYGIYMGALVTLDVCVCAHGQRHMRSGDDSSRPKRQRVEI